MKNAHKANVCGLFDALLSMHQYDLAEVCTYLFSRWVWVFIDGIGCPLLLAVITVMGWEQPLMLLTVLPLIECLHILVLLKNPFFIPFIFLLDKCHPHLTSLCDSHASF